MTKNPQFAYGRTPRERVFSRLTIDPSGCLLWAGYIDKDGYGKTSAVRPRTLTVHRVMYEWFAGPIPPGLVLDHLCGVRHCANVAHLEAVTVRENVLRSHGLPAVNARKTHCAHGHPFDEANTLHVRGQRQCRTCNRERERARYTARKAVR
jgi:hypothetical protein